MDAKIEDDGSLTLTVRMLPPADKPTILFLAMELFSMAGEGADEGLRASVSVAGTKVRLSLSKEGEATRYWTGDLGLPFQDAVHALIDNDAPSDDPYCAAHGRRFDPAVGCPECVNG